MDLQRKDITNYNQLWTEVKEVDYLVYHTATIDCFQLFAMRLNDRKQLHLDCLDLAREIRLDKQHYRCLMEVREVTCTRYFPRLKGTNFMTSLSAPSLYG